MKDKQKVLVAEFESIDAAYLRSMLERNGWESDLASNQMEVLHKLRERKYSLVLVNSNQSKVTGIETTRKIKALERELKRRIPVVGIASHTLEAEKRSILKAGADYCLTKPVYKNVLLETFKNVFGSNTLTSVAS